VRRPPLLGYTRALKNSFRWKESLARAVFPAFTGEGKLHCLGWTLRHFYFPSNKRFNDCVLILLRHSCFVAAPSHLEALAEIKLTADGIVDEKILCAFALNAAIVNQIRAVHDGKGLPHIVISDHDRKPRLA
jgi:hypothetical protein